VVSSGSDKSASVDRLKGALDRAFGERRAHFDEHAAERLLVLAVDSDIAGFTIVNGNARQGFASAYRAFRDMYSSRYVEWARKNLSFIICRIEHDPQDDEFFDQQQADSYFCKKYVIDLPEDDVELRKSVARLPFVPLPVDQRGGIVRPVSAQSLLRRWNLPAALARQIVVPRKAGAKSIVKWLSREGIPTLQDVGRDEVGADASAKRLPSPVRLKGLKIRDFRAYREQSFDLGADVVLLYGLNGLGKTSLFDAIDFACTGRIGRLCRRHIDASTFQEFARHLDARGVGGQVVLEFESDGRQTHVSRAVTDWSNAQMGAGQEVDRSAVMQRLTDARWPEKKPRVENLERHFRATHLFGQHQQELLLDFADDSTISEELVTRMLALDDYAEGQKKAQAVVEEVQRTLANRITELEQLRLSRRQHEEELKQLPQDDGGEESRAAFQDEARRIDAELRSEGDVEALAEPVNARQLRDWRSRLAATQDDWKRTLESLHGVERERKGIERIRVEFDLGLKRSEGIEKDITDHESKLKSQREVLAKARNIRQKLQRELSEARAQLDRELKAQELAGDAANIETRIAQLDADLNRVRRERSGLETTLQHHRTRTEAHRSELNGLLQQKSEIERVLRKTDELLAGYKTLREDRDTMSRLTVSLRQREAFVADLQRRLDSAKRKREEISQQHSAVEQRYRQLTEFEGDLIVFLDQAEAQAIGTSCPACGTEHGSHEELIARIRAGKAERSDETKAVAEEHRKIQAEARDAREQVEKLAADLQSARERNTEESGQRAEVERRIRVYGEIASVLAIDLDSEDPNRTIDQKAKQCATQLANTTHSIDALEAKISEQNLVLRQLTQQEGQLRSAEDSGRSNLADAWTKRQRVAQELATLGYAQPPDPSDIAKTIGTLQSSMEAVVAKLADTDGKVEEATRNLDSTTHSIDQLKEEHTRLSNQQAMGSEAIRSFDERLEPLGLPPHATPDAIADRIGKVSRQTKLLDDRLRRVRFLETALDTVGTSARVEDLKKKVTIADKEIKEAQKEEGRLEAIDTLCEQISRLLRRESNRAVESHISAYGPLTTLLQQRLRAVYGFEDVTLSARGGDVYVRVRRREKQLKPTDYFSDSQKQILMLSLFLAGRLTQTWSSFAPILMDDPVTHFDDLNAYAFAELIRGIVERGPRQHQFIISTCEERLFQLLRAKLGALQDGARVYHFVSIGKNGPVIERLA
jgi:exonuclease SbcC